MRARAQRRGTPAAILLAISMLGGLARAAEDPFAVQVIASLGRTVTAELADMDGDGRQDLIQVVTFGMPPDERRVVRVHAQLADGSIPYVADLEFEILGPAAAYDVANVDGRPGFELLLLERRGVEMVSVRRGESGRLHAERAFAPIPEDLTMAVSSDERGLDRLQIASFAFGSEPWLVVPGLGETFFLSPGGALHGRIRSGARANFFVQPTGLMLSESDIQIFLDAPRISVGDIDGDGRTDVLASGRHELRVFLRNEDGTFPREASRSIPLGRITMEDHIRGSGAVRSAAKDIDGDGLADLIVSETRGGIIDASSDTYLYFNRGSGWDLGAPDYAFRSGRQLGADQLIDVDGDRKLELMRVAIPISVLELIEIFLTEALDANLRVYPLTRAAVPAAASPDPWFEVKLDIPLDFETSRPAGFVPTVEYDFNGDGFRDYITSTDGSRLEIYVGSRKGGYKQRSASLKLETEGQIRSGDLNGDRLTDLVLFNTRRDDQPVKLLTNRGVLEGTPATIGPQE